MRNSVNRVAILAGLVAVAWAGAALVAAPRAEAAQAYYCTCKGEKKRFLASTRHCEVALKLSKSRTCSKTQFRVIYGLACAKQGCKLAN